MPLGPLPAGPVLGAGHRPIVHQVLGAVGSGADTFNLLTCATWPVASSGTVAGINNLCHRAGRAQLVVARVLAPAPFNLPLNTGARVQHPGRRRHPLMAQGRAALTCCRRGSGAGALCLTLNHGSHGAATRPPAPLTATASGACSACKVGWPQPTVRTRCWAPGAWCRCAQLALNTGAMVAAGRPPASLTYAAGHAVIGAQAKSTHNHFLDFRDFVRTFDAYI